ncbi:MAG: fibronectin type III domain-containing protein, partial [Verrucomicrobia bacterium]|nr:fibronectin type III domain-containing protein [Verrucomicrobiota bacterium]
TVVFSGALNLVSRCTGPANGPKDFDMVIPLATPFVYAPAWGHLLVDIRNFSGSGASYLSGQSSGTDAASRLIAGSVTAGSGMADTGVDTLEVVYVPTNAPPPPPPPPPQLLRGPYLNNRGPTNIVVRWRTEGSTDSRVLYGPDPGNLCFVADNALAAADHLVPLTGLQPETRYYYSLGTIAAPVFSNASFTFVTAPPTGASRPTRIWFVSDAGYGDYPWQAEVRDACLSYLAATGKPADVWLTGGDNSQYNAADEWYDYFFNGYPTLLRNRPILHVSFLGRGGRSLFPQL